MYCKYESREQQFPNWNAVAPDIVESDLWTGHCQWSVSRCLPEFEPVRPSDGGATATSAIYRRLPLASLSPCRPGLARSPPEFLPKICCLRRIWHVETSVSYDWW